jgi:hypothetical protein
MLSRDQWIIKEIRGKMKNSLSQIKMKAPLMVDIAKIVLRGKCVGMSALKDQTEVK